MWEVRTGRKAACQMRCYVGFRFRSAKTHPVPETILLHLCGFSFIPGGLDLIAYPWAVCLDVSVPHTWLGVETSWGKHKARRQEEGAAKPAEMVSPGSGCTPTTYSLTRSFQQWIANLRRVKGGGGAESGRGSLVVGVLDLFSIWGRDEERKWFGVRSACLPPHLPPCVFLLRLMLMPPSTRCKDWCRSIRIQVSMSCNGHSRN